MIPEKLILQALILIAVPFLVWLGLSERFTPLVLLPALLPVVVFFGTQVDIFFGCIVALYGSMVTVPGAPANLSLFTISCGAFSILMVLRAAVLKIRPQKTPLDRWVKTFAVIVIIIIAVRGIGIRAFGSTLWGGAGYINLLVAVAMFLTMRRLTFSPKVWRRSVLAMCVFALLPVISQAIYSFSGGRIYQQYLFVQPVGFIGTTVMSEMSGQGLERFQTGMASFLMFVPLIIYRKFKGTALLNTLAIWLFTCGLVALSGYRSGLVTALLIPPIYIFVGEKKFDFARPIAIGIAAALALMVIAQFAEHFPMSIQRSLSVVPFAKISTEARMNAWGTIDWRMQVWKGGLAKIPDYWLVGEGLAFDPDLYPTRLIFSTDHAAQAIVTKSYHNGPLSLLLVLGAPGLIVGIAFIVVSLVYFSKLLRADWVNPEMHRIFRCLYSFYVQVGVGFLVTYGDVQISFPQLFFFAALLVGIRRTDTAIAESNRKKAEREAEEKQPKRRRPRWRALQPRIRPVLIRPM